MRKAKLKSVHSTKSAKAIKPVNKAQHAKNKLRTAQDKASNLQKSLRAKLVAKTKEFATKIKAAEEAAYAKAVAEIMQAQSKKEKAKAKLIEAVERKFEKKHSKVTSKKAKAKKSSAKKAKPAAKAKIASKVKKTTAKVKKAAPKAKKSVAKVKKAAPKAKKSVAKVKKTAPKVKKSSAGRGRSTKQQLVATPTAA